MGYRWPEKGDKVYVREEGGHRWRSAIVLRFHKTRSPQSGRHLLKVQYRDGVVEEYVDPDDVSRHRPSPQRSGRLTITRGGSLARVVCLSVSRR